MGSLKLTLAEGERLLDCLLDKDIALEHECGGTLACATCRIIVREGLESLSPASEDELDMLERADASEPGSRLACQGISSGGDVVIELPRTETPQRAEPMRAIALPIALSERAARHFAAQLAKLPRAVAVRLSVESAGCSGFSYRVDPADAIRDGDVVFESRGICIAVDLASLPHVHGTTLDVVQEGLAQRLRFDNPNARQICGCGESFGT